MSLQRTAGKGFPPPWAMLPPYRLCFLTALQSRPKTVAASGQSLSQHSCRDSDTRARGSQSQRRIATDNVPNFLGFLVNHKVLRNTKLGTDQLRGEESNGVIKNLIGVHLVFNMAVLKSDYDQIKHFRSSDQLEFGIIRKMPFISFHW